MMLFITRLFPHIRSIAVFDSRNMIMSDCPFLYSPIMPHEKKLGKSSSEKSTSTEYIFRNEFVMSQNSQRHTRFNTMGLILYIPVNHLNCHLCDTKEILRRQSNDENSVDANVNNSNQIVIDSQERIISIFSISKCVIAYSFDVEIESSLRIISSVSNSFAIDQQEMIKAISHLHLISRFSLN